MEELLSLEILKRTDTDPNCDDDTTCDGSDVYRHGDGKCNNLNEPLWGSAGIQHLRLLDNEYNNGKSVRNRPAVTVVCLVEGQL